MKKTKVVVIGAGPGGEVTAIRAAQLGAQVTVIEKDEVGGICLNHGCIPTKALLGSVEALTTIKDAGKFGIEVDGIRPDFSEMMERKERILVELRKTIHQLFESNKVKFIKGTASLISPQKIRVDTIDGIKEIEADKIIIATGSKPGFLPIFDYNQPTVLTSRETLELREAPESLIIVGAGVIGLEFASIFGALGSRITMVELTDRVLPAEDIKISRHMQEILQRRNIEIFTETTCERVTDYGPDSITVKLENGEEISAQKLLVSVGHRPLSRGLGLENLGITMDRRGIILVSQKMETNVKGVYAVGDVIGGIRLAHVASVEGTVAAENAMGLESEIDYSAVPICIYTIPEIASVGLTYDKARAVGKRVKVGKFSFAVSGKAFTIGEASGFAQVVVDEETDKVLGAQIIGPHATDLIHEAALAIRLGVTAKQIGATIHAHPTLSETVMEAAKQITVGPRESMAERIKNLSARYLELLGFVTHEIMQPLGVLMGYLIMMRDGTLKPDQQKQAISAMLRNVDLLVGMNRKYLQFSRIESGEMSISKVKLKPYQEIVFPIVQDERPRLDQKKMTVKFENEEKFKEVEVLADPVLLRIVYSVLLRNALEYGNKGGKIVFGFKDEEDWHRFNVKNDGPGISKDKLDVIFQKFRRPEEKYRQIRGTGLGLFNAREIVKMHGGKIWAESKEEKWANFIFTLPRSP